mgnify:CR=1 FL=1
MYSLHLLSPFIYACYVEYIKQFKKVENNVKTFLFIRRYYNVFMSLFSLYMFYLTFISTYNDGKFESWNALVCQPYKSYIGQDIFLFSKYIEWFDTLFLVLSGKKISNLQYSHHMSTVIVVYLNDKITTYFVYAGLNTFIHTIMYWYFAFPKGLLKPYTSWITKFQLFQHVICILFTYYSLYMNKCINNILGLYVALCCYILYFIMFILFYLKKYRIFFNDSI